MTKKFLLLFLIVFSICFGSISLVSAVCTKDADCTGSSFGPVCYGGADAAVLGHCECGPVTSLPGDTPCLLGSRGGACTSDTDCTYTDPGTALKDKCYALFAPPSTKCGCYAPAYGSSTMFSPCTLGAGGGLVDAAPCNNDLQCLATYGILSGYQCLTYQGVVGSACICDPSSFIGTPGPLVTPWLNCNGAPVNGLCGSSNGQAFSAAPTSNFCSAGGYTGVSGSGPWTWTCLGYMGGSTASCTANNGSPPCGAPGGNCIVNLYNPLGSVSNFSDVMSSVTTFSGGIITAITTLVFLWAGILFLTAGAYPANYEKGKKALLYAIIGLAILAAGTGLVLIINAVATP